MADGRPENSVGKWIAASSYPAVIVFGLVLYALLTAAGWPAVPASYVAALVGAALITLHEWTLPYRAEWTPGRAEVGNDIAFMVAVQIALPYLLSISLVVAASRYLAARNLTVTGIWPHDWPVAVQIFLMLLIAEFFRYWLHRAFHEFAPMWRLHAVHHSPHRLYWLNVGRFHPIEKAVQFTVDAMPFALLGVTESVLAGYAVFYAINGFFQHSNCRVRLGPLNYLVSGPELHRWHHSEVPAEANTNYGNNLIVWDLLFGTWFLPRDREVGSLGLMNRHYPSGFLQQMTTPFVPGLEMADRPRVVAD